jgi:hypothetical protein
MSGQGSLILITGLISMILAVGAICWFGTKRGYDEKDSRQAKVKRDAHPIRNLLFSFPTYLNYNVTTAICIPHGSPYCNPPDNCRVHTIFSADNRRNHYHDTISTRTETGQA